MLLVDFYHAYSKILYWWRKVAEEGWYRKSPWIRFGNKGDDGACCVQITIKDLNWQMYPNQKKT